VLNAANRGRKTTETPHMPLRIVFLGSGRLAEPVFSALLDSPHTVCGLVTQPDRTGPGQRPHGNPLKDLAGKRGLPVLQPERIKTADAVAAVTALAADVHVVAAYGQLLPRALLDAPQLGTINVHASLLPRYRGATPIHAAILHGDAETGITIIRLVPELDAGPILASVRTPILPRETTGELEARLAQLAVPITLEVLAQLESGTAQPVEQDHRLATYAGKLSKADGRIDWRQPAVVVERHIRAMQPWPGPFTYLPQAGKMPLRMQILAATVCAGRADCPPGQIIAIDDEAFTVQCGEDGLRIERVHPDGKRAMSAGEFLRGRKVSVGDVLTAEPPTPPC
jgi:methionyl-tRNA formyltransferase